MLTMMLTLLTSDQVYDGSIHEDMNAARVVARTRGLVLDNGSR